MKRWLILLLALVLLAAFAVPAGAKMIFLGKNSRGSFFVIDRVFKKVGDCSYVATLFLYRGLLKTRYGMVKAAARVFNVCCRTQTYQLVAFRYLGADRKPLHSVKVPPSLAKTAQAKPGTMGYLMVKKVCSPGFPK